MNKGQANRSLHEFFAAAALKRIHFSSNNFWIYFLFFNHLVAMTTSQLCIRFIWLVEAYSRNISVKALSKYLQRHSNNFQFCPL